MFYVRTTRTSKMYQHAIDCTRDPADYNSEGLSGVLFDLGVTRGFDPQKVEKIQYDPLDLK